MDERVVARRDLDRRELARSGRDAAHPQRRRRHVFDLEVHREVAGEPALGDLGGQEPRLEDVANVETEHLRGDQARRDLVGLARRMPLDHVEPVERVPEPAVQRDQRREVVAGDGLTVRRLTEELRHPKARRLSHRRHRRNLVQVEFGEREELVATVHDDDVVRALRLKEPRIGVVGSARPGHRGQDHAGDRTSEHREHEPGTRPPTELGPEPEPHSTHHPHPTTIIPLTLAVAHSLPSRHGQPLPPDRPQHEDAARSGGCCRIIGIEPISTARCKGARSRRPGMLPTPASSHV